MEPKFLEGLTFDDVLLVPQASDIEPKDARLDSSPAQGIFLTLPFLSAAMDRVTGAEMAIALGRAGGLGVLHRNCSVVEQVRMVRRAKKEKVKVAAACGPFDMERALALEKAGADAVVIDCAHGHNLSVIASAQAIRKKLRSAKLIFGNIATAAAARAVVGFVDAIKVGVGPGSICTTRLVSGVGVPQLTAIMEVAKVAHKKGVPVIADGGMRTSGDIAKALAAGASAVMTGNLFAGALEAPGKVIVRNGTRLKEYRGMGSTSVIRSTSAEGRYFTKGRALVPEGVEAFVACKGSAAEIAAELVSSIQVAMGYVGARNLEELRHRARFMRITPSAAAEGHPHSLAEIVG